MTLKIAIAIATAGRRNVLTDTIRHLARQARIADELLISPAKPADFDPACLIDYPGHCDVFHGAIGTAAQRNVLIDASNADVMIFFDDDFLPCNDYVAEVEALFASRPEVVMATGLLLADAILGPGLNHEQGLHILERAGPNLAPFSTTAIYNGYGCNMAVQLRAVRGHRIRFDENLPLYAWLEDIDFSRQLVPYGDIVRSARLRGVHLGTKGASRTAGRRLGYSQIANPVYLARKGTMHWPLARTHMTKNVVANSVRSFAPEAWVDRRGRLRGNVLALWDWVRGRIDPRRILEF